MASKETLRDLVALKQLTRADNETACPTSVQFGTTHRAYVVAIGKDNIATVYLSDDDARMLDQEYQVETRRNGYG